MLQSLEVKVIGVFLLIGSLILGGWVLHHNGYNEGKTEADLAIANANTKAEADLAAKNKIIEVEQYKLNESFNTIIDKNQEIENAKNDYQHLLTQYHDGIKRLSVRTDNPRDTTGNNKTPTDTSGTASQNTVLMPELSDTILSFARGYSENLRLKNECIDLLNAERAVK